MKRYFQFPTALVCALAIVAVAGCGGGEDSGSGTVDPPDPTTRVTADQFSNGFAEETGVELTAEDFLAGSTLLRFDDDGEATEFSEAETAFMDEYGTAEIYVVGTEGDPEGFFDLVTGEGRSEGPVESGGDTVRLAIDIADEPDADGVIWVEQCVRYEKQKSLNACSWTGNKRYGENVIVSWTATSDSLDDAASRLDETVSAVVSGA